MFLNKKILISESHYRSRTWIHSLNDIFVIEWISLLRSEFNYINSNFPNIQIYDMHHSLMEIYTESTEEKLAYLSKSEIKYNFNYNSLIQTDRNLSLRKAEDRINYLYYITKKLESIIFLSKPDAVFLEITWTHELVLEKICDYFEIPLFCPVKCKLLKDRFFLFNSSKYNNIYSFFNNNIGEILADNAINQVQNNLKPQYFDKFNNRSKITTDKFLTLIRIFYLWYSGKSNKYIQIHPLRSAFTKIYTIIALNLSNLIYTHINSSYINFKFIFITLHVQPEASIDVAGQDFSNQIEVIKSISRTTPISYRILVKDHSHAVGKRNLKFYYELSKIPNVLLANTNENSLNYIKKSSLTISITGTSSLEAAILGIPSLNIEEMYYHKLLTKKKFNPFYESISDILKLTEYQNTSNLDIKIRNILADIQSHSLSGNTGDFYTDNNVLSKKNINILKISLYNFFIQYFNSDQTSTKINLENLQ